MTGKRDREVERPSVDVDDGLRMWLGRRFAREFWKGFVHSTVGLNARFSPNENAKRSEAREKREMRGRRFFGT